MMWIGYLNLTHRRMWKEDIDASKVYAKHLKQLRLLTGLNHLPGPLSSPFFSTNIHKHWIHVAKHSPFVCLEIQRRNMIVWSKDCKRLRKNGKVVGSRSRQETRISIQRMSEDWRQVSCHSQHCQISSDTWTLAGKLCWTILSRYQLHVTPLGTDRRGSRRQTARRKES